MRHALPHHAPNYFRRRLTILSLLPFLLGAAPAGMPSIVVV
ncbi:hypothetical protein [Pleomorphomonas sp. PLEO]